MIPKVLRNPLDRWVLYCIGEGHETKYELSKECGVSDGASTSALPRLEARRLIQRHSHSPGRRGRIRFRLTQRGHDLLQPRNIHRLLRVFRIAAQRPGASEDLETVTRLVALAWAVGDKWGAVDIAQDALRQWKWRADSAIPQSQRNPWVPLRLSHWMIDGIRRDRAMAEIASLEGIVKALRTKATQHDTEDPPAE